MTTKLRRPFRPWQDRDTAIDRALDAREAGKTLRQAAAAAGVHVATLCRWMARDDLLRRSLAAAREAGRRQRGPAGRRPRVPWHPDCPRCGGPAEVHRGRGDGLLGFPFWRCRRWPECPWASWRPRAPGDCPWCGGPRFWSHARKSIGCPGCGRRVRTDGH